ncbi:hypothetical protein [Corynebacterium kalidii]
MNTDDRHLDRRQRDIDQRSRWVGRALIAGGLAALIVLLVCLTGPDVTVGVVTAGAAVATAFIAWKSLTQLVDDSKQRTRPYVSAQLQPGLWGPGSSDLRVSNDGESMAYDVVIDFDIPDRAAWPDKEFILPRLEKHLVGHSFYLPPHTAQRFMWRSKEKPGQKDEVEYGMTSDVTVTVMYNDEEHHDPGHGPVKHWHFKETYQATTALHGAVTVPQEGKMGTEGTALEKKLHSIDGALRAIAVHIGELRR